MIKKKLQKSFIKLLSVFIAIVLLAGLLLFYSTMQFVFFNYIDQANERLIRQIGSTFELIIDQVSDKAYKYGLYDHELVRLVKERNQGALHSMRLYEALDSIVLENQYLHSAYLYSEEEGIVFDTRMGCSYPVDTFYDQAAVEAMKMRHFSKADPRAIRRVSGNVELLYSIVVVLPEQTSQGYATMLSINVDMNKVYQDIMKRNQLSEDGKLYIYSQDNHVLVSADTTDLGRDIGEIANHKTIDMKNASFWTILSHKSGVVQVFGDSQALKWNFCLLVPFEINISNMINKYVAFVFISMIAAVFLLIIYIVMHHTTKPLDGFLQHYNENIVKKLLTDPSFMRDKNPMELECMERMFGYENFRVLLVEAAGYSSGELVKRISASISQMQRKEQKLLMESVTLYHGRVAVVCNYHQTTQTMPVEQHLLHHDMQNVHIAVSGPKQGYGELYAAVRECEEILEYKLSLPRRIMDYDAFTKLKGSIEYPVNYEKQMINNLLAANLESCMFYLDKYMEHLFENQSIISDMNIKNYIYQLQTELLKHISSLPISIKTSGSLDLKTISDKEELYDSLADLLHTICLEIAKKDNNNENILVQSILDYIQNHLTDVDFNLNTISYQFNMNRNYLARLIKESTSYAFNDYVNLKKIEIAKEKLNHTDQTIEQIAGDAGFSYSHYFIKVFKSIEGMTPGAYRKMMNHNNNAPISGE